MILQVKTYNCPNCQAPISLNDQECEYCSSKLYFDNIEDLNKITQLPKFESFFHNGELEGNPDACFSLGLCHLYKEQYQYAMKNFDKAIELLYTDSDVYYYQSLTLLQGKRPRLHSSRTIERITHDLDIAIKQVSKGKYFYLYAIIIEDYYEGKHLKSKFKSKELYAKAASFSCSYLEQKEIEDCIHLVRG